MNMSYFTTRDIVIPAGTELIRAADQRGGRCYVEAIIGHGRDFTSNWVVQVHPDAIRSGDFEEGVRFGDADRATHEPSPAVLAVPVGIPSAYEQFSDLMAADPDYAWSWHCNIAMPIMDATGCSHEKANTTAAYLMSRLFDIDITKHENFQYRKSEIERIHEAWMDRHCDAQAIEAGTAKTAGLGPQDESAVRKDAP